MHLESRPRRCTFRRLDPVRMSGRGPAAYYLVTCLYGGSEAALPLGDLAAARAVCGACQAPDMFDPTKADARSLDGSGRQWQ
ncbi:hypothetical protein BH23CHL8_BH23CHL8_18750 [soil metagenome]